MQYKSKSRINIYLVIFSCILLFTSACKEEKKAEVKSVPQIKDTSILGIWKRTEIKRISADKKEESLSKEELSRTEKNYYINIFPNGKGSVIYKTEVDNFTWKTKTEGETTDSLHCLVDKMALGITEFKLVEKGGESRLEVIKDFGKTKMVLKKVSQLTSNVLEDPSHPENNLWRVRAKRTISDTEIEKKVDNYLMHYAYLFKAALDKKNPRKFSNKHSQGILKVYKNNIGIVSKNNITEDWYSYFYNEKEAHKAYDMLKRKIKTEKIKFDKPDDWIANNYKIMQAITADISM